MSYPGTLSDVGYKDTFSLDAFSRLRVSQLNLLHASTFLFDLLPHIYETVATGTGTVTKLTNIPSARLAVTAGAGTAAMQSYQTVIYRPGRSQEAAFTFNFGAAVAGVTKRVGVFNVNDGFFFEDDGTGVGIVRRTSTSGAPVDTRVAQASWNIDPMDGTGPSGVTIDWTKDQIGWIDYQWLGSGRIRYGLNVGGRLWYVHQVLVANILTVPSTASGSLSVRVEVTTAGVATGSMDFTCSMVGYEGASDIPTYSGNANTFGVAVAGQSLTTTMQTVLVVRLRAAYNRADLTPDQLSVYNTGGNPVVYEFAIVHGFIGVTLDPWVSTGTASEQSTTIISASPATGGQVMHAAWLANGNANDRKIAQIRLDRSLLRANANIAGAPDLLVVRARTLTATTTAHFALDFSEEY